MPFGAKTRVGTKNRLLDVGAHWSCLANTMDGTICAAAVMRAVYTIMVAAFCPFRHVSFMWHFKKRYADRIHTEYAAEMWYRIA